MREARTPDIRERIDRLTRLLGESSPGEWRVDGHQILDSNGEVVARIGTRRPQQHANAELIVFLRLVAPILALEVQRLRRILGGAMEPPADAAEAIDRMVGMLEAAETEASCMKVLVGLCPSCVDLVAPPFESCRHQLANSTPEELLDPDGPLLDYPPAPASALPRPHPCELREQGMMAGGSNFRCTCCLHCTVECTHAV